MGFVSVAKIATIQTATASYKQQQYTTASRARLKWLHEKSITACRSFQEGNLNHFRFHSTLAGIMSAELYIEVNRNQLPICYRPEYNVHFYGLEKLHPFDSKKWGNIVTLLKRAGYLNDGNFVIPNEARKKDLLMVHTRRYLNSLQYSFNVARIAEIPPLFFTPNCIIQKKYLKPMRYQTGGSVLAGKLALDRGWAINIGGGFHHCSAKKGGGFCPYADISLMINFLFNKYPTVVQNVMIVDLDAHQGNGYQHDFIDNQNVFIMDVYNKLIYPKDKAAKAAIKCRVELLSGTKDEEYLTKVECNLKKSLRMFHPDLLVYNAGTDILEGDPLGLLRISETGIIHRDELMFKIAQEMKIPIVMLTSGGYLKKTARVVATSILNLHDSGLIPDNYEENYRLRM